MDICFIGGGNMASAMIGGLLRKGWTARKISVVEIDSGARERLASTYGIEGHADASLAVPRVDCVVLAVKPQHMRGVARALSPLLRPETLIISIAAGIRLIDLSRWLGGHERIVRAMPNTPALTLAGMTGLYASAAVQAPDRDRAEQILAAAGRTLWVDREERLDGVTAVSGSGPAYVFYFMESLQQAAAELGFQESDARLLALETFRGAAKLAAESGESAAILRARVTSKGGTTERAISELEAHGVRDAIVGAVRAAAERSRELGDALGADQPDIEN
jgi:pyrroline-5-carboxylate reductase